MEANANLAVQTTTLECTSLPFTTGGDTRCQKVEGEVSTGDDISDL
jgi:hypothetical protein